MAKNITIIKTYNRIIKLKYRIINAKKNIIKERKNIVDCTISHILAAADSASGRLYI